MKEVIKMLKVQLLHANQGDCIVITYGEKTKPHYVIIDSGIGKTCTRELKLFLERVQKTGQMVDLIILTHYDADHIQGFLALMKYKIINSNTVKTVWMNYGNDLSKAVSSNSIMHFNVSEVSCETSAKQGKDFYKYLCENKIALKSVILAGDEVEIDCAKFKILSPSPEQVKRMLEQIIQIDGNTIYPYDSTRKKETAGSNADFQLSIDEVLKNSFVEDSKIANCSSIAFIFEYKDFKILLLGDSVPSQIINALNNLGYSETNKLQLSICKLSHHGSNRNTSDQLLELIDCNNFIISSDWNGPRPGKECLSRIAVNIKGKKIFYCNYPHKSVFTESESAQYNIIFEDIEHREIILEDENA